MRRVGLHIVSMKLRPKKVTLWREKSRNSPIVDDPLYKYATIGWKVIPTISDEKLPKWLTTFLLCFHNIREECGFFFSNYPIPCKATLWRLKWKQCRCFHSYTAIGILRFRGFFEGPRKTRRPIRSLYRDSGMILWFILGSVFGLVQFDWNWFRKSCRKSFRDGHLGNLLKGHVQTAMCVRYINCSSETRNDSQMNFRQRFWL